MARMTGTATFFATQDDRQNAKDALDAWNADDTQVILRDGFGQYAVGSQDFTHRGWEIISPEEIEKLLGD